MSHRRGPGVEWKPSGGGFGRGGRALLLQAQRDFEPGDALTMDYGPGKPDSDIFLNYGAMDGLFPRVSQNPVGFPMHFIQVNVEETEL